MFTSLLGLLLVLLATLLLCLVPRRTRDEMARYMDMVRDE